MYGLWHLWYSLLGTLCFGISGCPWSAHATILLLKSKNRWSIYNHIYTIFPLPASDESTNLSKPSKWDCPNSNHRILQVCEDSFEAAGRVAMLIGCSVNQDGRSASMTAPHGNSARIVEEHSMIFMETSEAATKFCRSFFQNNIRLYQTPQDPSDFSEAPRSRRSFGSPWERPRATLPRLVQTGKDRKSARWMGKIFRVAFVGICSQKTMDESLEAGLSPNMITIAECHGTGNCHAIMLQIMQKDGTKTAMSSPLMFSHFRITQARRWVILLKLEPCEGPAAERQFFFGTRLNNFRDIVGPEMGVILW